MNRWLLILGANSDIAYATAKKFAENKWNIILASRDIESLNNKVSDLKIRYEVKAEAAFFDAESLADHQSFLQNIKHDIDGVILAFGYLGNQNIAQTQVEEREKIVIANYLGAVNILEIIAAYFENKKSGFIIGISSVAGDRGRASNYIYGSAKAGLSTYLAGLRHRLAKENIPVTTIKPGFVATKMTAGLPLPAKLTASPEQVANSIYASLEKNKSVIYVKPIWRFIMLIIRAVPDFIFNRTKL
jgi:decaprenylphospho-beta-D-erythro-pentofuranosid-2-ulose 2-reductase